MMVRGMIGVVGSIVAAIGSMAVLTAQGEGNRLTARQPAFTITTSPARDASFLQQQAQVQWGKPYIDAQLRTVGNQIFFLDPVRLAKQFDALAESSASDEESMQGDEPIDGDLSLESESEDEIGLLQTSAHARSRTRMLARERLAKKRGGAHDKRAQFKNEDSTPSIRTAMIQTAADMQKGHRKRHGSVSTTKAQAALIQMTQTAEQFAKAAHTNRQDAQEDARRKRLARSVAANRAAKTKAAVSALSTSDTPSDATDEIAKDTSTEPALDIIEAPHDSPKKIERVVEGVLAANRLAKKARKVADKETSADLVLEAKAAVSLAREHGKRAKAGAEERVRSGKERMAQIKERQTEIKAKNETKRTAMPAEALEAEDIGPLKPISQLHLHGIHRHTGSSEPSFSQTSAKSTKKTRSQMMSATRSKSAPAPHGQTSVLQTSHSVTATKHGSGTLKRTAHIATAKDAGRKLAKSS